MAPMKTTVSALTFLSVLSASLAQYGSGGSIGGMVFLFL